MRKCDLLISGKFILTMNDEMEIIEDGAIAISAGRIAALGPVSEIESTFQPSQVLQAGNSMILPGLVNTHTHAAMSYFRGMADDLPLSVWLNEHIWPAEKKHVGAEFVAASSRLAMLEMVKAGITCFNDMYFFPEETAGEARKAGLRALVGIGILKFPMPGSASARESLEKISELQEKLKNDPLIRVAVCPHSIYATEEEAIIRAAEIARDNSLLLHMHVAETEKEADDCLARFQASPVAYLDKLGVLSDNFLAAHAVWVGGEDLEIFAKRRVKVSHNPVSNMKLASGIAPIALMNKLGITVGLGTDGAASNNTLDLFTEMRAAALLHKVINGDPASLPSPEIVKMATIGGARALGLDSEIGSLEPGKSADLITISLDKPHLSPLYNPYSHLVYSAAAQDVDDSVIAGKVVMRSRKPTQMDEDMIIAQAQKYFSR